MQLAENVIVANKFRLARELGRGGMGSVWLAHHEELDIPCAVKFIEGEAVNSPEMRERFSREAKAAAQLRSPHVVQILDQGTWEGTPYIAMELLDGEDLNHRLDRVGRLPHDQLVAILSQVARALTRAHALGIVHRDLKPDNIFLVRDDDRELVKILDFGIAKMNSNALGNGSGTRTGSLMGTPFYMSPEQAQGTKAVDSRSDLWAVGVIAYESLTGARPFESSALGDLLLKICAMPIPSILEAAPDLPPAVEGWWARASSRDPAQRFQTAKELVDALATALGVNPGGEVSMSSLPDGVVPSRLPLSSVEAGSGARTVSPLEVNTEIIPPRRSPALVIGLGLGALLVIGGSFAGLMALRKGDPPPITATQPTATTSATAVPTPPPADPPVVTPVPPASAAASLGVPAAPAPPVDGKPSKAEPKTDNKAAKVPVKSDKVTRPPRPIKDETGF
jgi:serine/threonine-protein kinase